MSTLTLVRHGQANFGGERYDLLSPHGEAQARALGGHFTQHGAEFSRMHVGPRQRHLRTAELACGSLDFVIDTNLDEFAEGEQILAMAPVAESLQAQLQAYAGIAERWAMGAGQIDGVEPAAEFRARVGQWLANVTASPEAGQHVLAVTSAGVIAAAVAEVLALDGRNFFALMRVIGNASVTRLSFAPGRVGLREFNATGHLPVALSSLI
ncbi:MAG: histidine phosphatase family protein [Pseudoxanthomonas sp.]